MVYRYNLSIFLNIRETYYTPCIQSLCELNSRTVRDSGICCLLSDLACDHVGNQWSSTVNAEITSTSVEQWHLVVEPIETSLHILMSITREQCRQRNEGSKSNSFKLYLCFFFSWINVLNIYYTGIIEIKHCTVELLLIIITYRCYLYIHT